METRNGIPWLPQDEYDRKAQELRDVFDRICTEAFGCYGQQVLIPGAVRELFKAAEDFSLWARGMDKTISLDRIRQKGAER